MFLRTNQATSFKYTFGTLSRQSRRKFTSAATSESVEPSKASKALQAIRLRAANFVKCAPTMLVTMKTCVISKTATTSTNLVHFVNGPLRNSALLSREMVRLVAKEQAILPRSADWPAARETYQRFIQATVDGTKAAWTNGTIYETVVSKLKNISWGQVMRAGRVSLEMAAFYYIGNLAGKTIGYPVKLLRKDQESK